MYKNVQVNHSNNATTSTIPFSSSTSSSASSSSRPNQKVISLPVQVTSAFSSSALPNNNVGSDSGQTLPVSSYLASDSIMSSSSKLKTDVDQLDDLVKDLLTEVNRPISNPTTTHRYSYQRQTNDDLTNPQRVKTVREERIRIKRGNATDIPIQTSSSTTTTTTTTTTNKPQVSSASVDEHLIDSLLESVQNTLKKRAERNQSNWSTDMPIPTRRTYSSSATYNDSVHRMDPNRGRFPIKLVRTDSPTSTISSRRPYSRQEYRDGYTSASTTAIPTHFRATSEPPPDGPIELRRMDLIRSPSRTYFEHHPPPPPPEYYYQYSRSTLPSRGIRVRGRDYSGYDTDTGITTSYGYGPRYYRAPPPSSHFPPPPPPPQQMHPYYRQYESQRSMFRPDGYDTDSGLISSGRVHMARTLPPRMAAIPETVVVNNRIISSSNLNTLPNDIRTSSFLNQNIRRENISGYETDSGMNTRQYRQVPVDMQTNARTTNTNQRYQPTQEQFRGTSIPVFSQQSQSQQQQRTTSSPPPSSSVETIRKDITVLPKIFPGSVGLSNPLSENKSEQIDLKRKISNDNITKRSARPHAAVIENKIIETSTINPDVTKTTTTDIVINTNVENQGIKIPTFPVINQSYNANTQTRVGNSSMRTQEESSRRSSVSSTTESDVSRTGAYQAHNVSRFWYKEKMSREDAVNLLKTKSAGTFLIRDSQGFPGSYGLAVKVETLPPGIHPKPGADPQAELVRHYLIERTPTGHVRLKGCPNEPDFANLSALVYQHTLTPLALPTKLLLPTVDLAQDYHPVQNNLQQETKKMSIKDLLEKGAACNVVYLNNIDVESLSGQMAVAKALRSTFDNAERLQPTIVNFKVSNTGITLADTKKKLFSRRHFPKEYVTYCGLDYETDRYWTFQFPDLEMLPRAKCFGFVSKKLNGTKSSQPENECHIFAEVDPTQPSSAIVNFVSKVMIGSVPV